MASEQEIETNILNELEDMHGIVAFKFPRGQKSFSRRNTVRYSGNGVADIIVNIAHAGMCFVIYLEVKAKTGRLRKSQINFRDEIMSIYGLYYLVRSVQDALDAIEDARKHFNSYIQLARMPREG